QGRPPPTRDGRRARGRGTGGRQAAHGSDRGDRRGSDEGSGRGGEALPLRPRSGERPEARRRRGRRRGDGQVPARRVDVQQEDASLPDEVARAVGRSLALVAWRLGDLNAVPLADLTGEAYLGFDEQAAELLRERDSGTDDNERRTEEP